MTDLRKAAEMILEVYDNDYGEVAKKIAWSELRQALAQPEQEQYVTKVVAVHEDGTYTLERIPLPKREWVGLTEDEIEEYKWMGQDVMAVIKEVQTTLKEKNT